jgi:hypothetical protein
VQEVVREVQAFAEMRDDFTTDSDTESEMTYDFAEDGSAYSSFSPERCICICIQQCFGLMGTQC